MTARKPTSMKIIQGTDQPCRMNPLEPKPKRGSPKCPQHLSDYAKKYWKQIVPMLDNLGVLTIADGTALEALCECYSEIRMCREVIKARGGSSTYETVNRAGEVMIKQYPEIKQIADADRRLRSWLMEFGLSPAQRGRVSGAIVTEENTFSEF